MLKNDYDANYIEICKTCSHIIDYGQFEGLSRMFGDDIKAFCVVCGDEKAYKSIKNDVRGSVMSINEYADEVQYKINELNKGVLDPLYTPEKLSSKNCSDLGLLCFELGFIIKELNESNFSENDYIQAYKSLEDLESKVIKIFRGK